MSNKGIGTKSQQALKLQQEQNKAKRKTKSKERKEAEAKQLFELKQPKKEGEAPGKISPNAFLQFELVL